MITPLFSKVPFYALRNIQGCDFISMAYEQNNNIDVFFFLAPPPPRKISRRMEMEYRGWSRDKIPADAFEGITLYSTKNRTYFLTSDGIFWQ